ncbi:hypothetical protein [Pseudomonas coronafaciens]|uniref:hypothetical protein n=1 Tax=Pseudomonas coronafaciens TaxID=53409 RepID=UPI0037A6F147
MKAESKITTFTKALADLYSLPPVAPKLLEELLKSVDRDGDIHLSKWRKESIAKSLDSSLSTVNNALQVFKKHKIILPIAVSVFELNPEIFGDGFNNLYSGSWKSVKSISIDVRIERLGIKPKANLVLVGAV